MELEPVAEYQGLTLSHVPPGKGVCMMQLLVVPVLLRHIGAELMLDGLKVTEIPDSSDPVDSVPKVR